MITLELTSLSKLQEKTLKKLLNKYSLESLLQEIDKMYLNWDERGKVIKRPVSAFNNWIEHAAQYGKIFPKIKEEKKEWLKDITEEERQANIIKLNEMKKHVLKKLSQ